ncbi:FAD-dependent monooxygenase [Actinomycetospora endophytica]|uniref:FAD-dependent monooxygenase n=1 Tax=Actinomycetospora endophytica TaxID=2291215 RepID=A0ABS8P587_9PSEU|nr:FAD-dependent monooxygenase [Actinomycetospora endophytica]MCD2192219.1 FAD-dependent monooxygenase [Actinomycetospora endophytica]
MHVLVSGAGIAGPTFAHGLLRAGHRVTVVESSPAPRPGGQAIDVRGPALEVADRLGISADIRAARTDMRGMSIVAADGRELMSTTSTTLTGGPVGGPDVEILRDDLATLLLAAAPGAEYVFGDRVTALAEHDDGVDVTLASGRTERADVVVGADGLHSTVRALAGFPTDGVLRHLGSHLAVYTMPNEFGLDRWQVFCRFPDAMAGLYTARENAEVRVNLGWEAPGLSYDHRDLTTQRRLVTEAFEGRGWWVPRMLAGLADAPDFYLAPMSQVVLPRWSAGRVVLLGDAAWCTTPMSGQGTSLAMIGAHLLAHELGPLGAVPSASALDEAFRRWESTLRPVVLDDQRLAIENAERTSAMAEALDVEGAEAAIGGGDEQWAATTAATRLVLP